MQKGSPVLVVVLIVVILVALVVVYKFTIAKNAKSAAPQGKFEGMSMEQYRQKMMQPAPPPGKGSGPMGAGGPAGGGTTGSAQPSPASGSP